MNHCFPDIVKGTHISDDGKWAIFNPAYWFDDQKYFRVNKDGTSWSHVTDQFKEYGIVKYLLDGRGCKYFLIIFVYNSNTS